MKYILSSIIGTLLFFSTFSQVHVNGYYRKNGTYVQSHYRSSPDGIPTNNWSYPGNINPYTGKAATGNPETYLNNYYNRNNSNATSISNSTSYDYARAKTYTIKKRQYSYSVYSLYSANYFQMSADNTLYSYYKVNDSYGYQVGYISSNNFKSYKIYDNSNNKKGIIKITRNGYYTVCDDKGYELYTNKPKGRFLAGTIVIV